MNIKALAIQIGLLVFAAAHAREGHRIDVTICVAAIFVIMALAPRKAA